MENATQPISKPLPSTGQLVSETWKLFTSTWNTSVKTSIFLLYLGVAYFAVSLLVKWNASFLLLDGVVHLIGALLTIWIGVRILMTMLRLEAGTQPLPAAEESQKAWSLLLSMLWVAFLTGLAVIGGSLLLIIPGIYLAFALTFSQTVLVDQGIRGTQALAASRALVKGRWWATAGRMFTGGFVFGLLIAVCTGIGSFLIVRIVGVDAFNNQDPLAVSGVQLVANAVQAAFLPLIFAFQVKMYRALQKTR